MLRLELFYPSESILNEAIHFSYRTHLTIYDCFYIALATKLNCQLITADKKIYDTSHHFLRVKLL